MVTILELVRGDLTSQLAEIVIAKDLRIPNENITIMRWSGRKY
jgi:hypothetical protein